MAEKTKVTRITAKTTKEKAPKVAKVVKAKKVSKAPKPLKEGGKKSFFGRIGGYFKGAWVELRQVRWPNRRATWALTLGVTVFSGFFVVMILLLDTLFKFLFELIIT